MHLLEQTLYEEKKKLRSGISVASNKHLTVFPLIMLSVRVMDDCLPIEQNILLVITLSSIQLAVAPVPLSPFRRATPNLEDRSLVLKAFPHARLFEIEI